MLNFEIKTANHMPKVFSLEDVLRMNLPVFYVCDTPDFYWTHDVNEEKFKNIVNLKESLPVVKCYQALKNSDPELTFFSDNKKDLISQISDHFIAQFNFYIQSLEVKLHKLKNMNYVIAMLQKIPVDKQIQDLQGYISQVKYFTQHKLSELINVEFFQLDNFILPENIEELFKTEEIYILNINNENDTFKAGISQHTLVNKSIKYLMLFGDITKNKEAEIIFSIPTEKINTFDNVYITKNNRETYNVKSFKNGLFFYMTREEAEEQLSSFIEELNKTF